MNLAQKKDVERNLLIKKFIKNIVYSKDEIRLNLYYLPRKIESERSKGLLHKDNVILRGEKDFDVSQNASLSRSNASKNVQNKERDFRMNSEIPQFYFHYLPYPFPLGEEFNQKKGELSINL